MSTETKTSPQQMARQCRIENLYSAVFQAIGGRAPLPVINSDGQGLDFAALYEACAEDSDQLRGQVQDLTGKLGKISSSLSGVASSTPQQVKNLFDFKGCSHVSLSSVLTNDTGGGGGTGAVPSRDVVLIHIEDAVTSPVLAQKINAADKQGCTLSPEVNVNGDVRNRVLTIEIPDHSNEVVKLFALYLSRWRGRFPSSPNAPVIESLMNRSGVDPWVVDFVSDIPQRELKLLGVMAQDYGVVSLADVIAHRVAAASINLKGEDLIRALSINI